MNRMFIYFVLFIGLCVARGEQSPKFEESITILPLEDGHVFSNFQFTIQHDHDLAKEAKHFTVFPKPVGQLLNAHGVEELHVTMTGGRWHSKQWGSIPHNVGLLSSPLGAEVTAWFSSSPLNSASLTSSAQAKASVDRRWNGLLQGLAGLLCASLQHIHTERSWLEIEPSNSNRTTWFRPMSTHVASDAHGRVGSLSRETVCTENLTPLLKLLPSYASKTTSSQTTSSKLNAAHTLAGLLQPLSLFDSPYHSLSLRVLPYCESLSSLTSQSCDNRMYTMQIGVAFVSAPSSIPKKTSLADLPSASVLSPGSTLRRLSYFHHWTLSSLFRNTALRRISSVASRSELHMLVPKCLTSNSTSSEKLKHLHVNSHVGRQQVQPHTVNSNDSDFTRMVWDLKSLLFSSSHLSPVSSSEATSSKPILDLDFEAFVYPSEVDASLSCDSPSSTSFMKSAFVSCHDVNNLSSSNSRLVISNHEFDIQRWISSDDMRAAALNIRIKRLSPSSSHSAASFEYIDQFPWFMHLLYHTLEIQINGNSLDLQPQPSTSASAKLFSFSPASSSWLSVSPAVPRQRPHHLQLRAAASLIPNIGDELSISLRFDRAFLRVEEFPVDVARGFDISASVLLHFPSSSNSSDPFLPSSLSPHRIYSDPLLLRMPYPDFSMPFNVIAFTSTLLAFFFGSVFGALYRNDKQIFQAKSLPRTLKLKYYALRAKRLGKKLPEGDDVVVSSDSTTAVQQ